MESINPSYNLPQRWADYLSERGVTPEVAKQRGYREVLQGHERGGGDFAAAWGFPPESSGLLIPLHGVLGKEAVQLRLDDPEGYAQRKGLKKAPKFLSPGGSRQRTTLSTSPVTRELLAQFSGLMIVEGVTRVDALAAYNIPAVGIPGAWNWKGKRRDNGPSLPLPDFESLVIRDNRVYVCPDGDVLAKKSVHQAMQRLADWLLGAGADLVKVLALPGGQGLDDWLAAQQLPDATAVLDALKPYLREYLPPPPPKPPGALIETEAAGDPWARTPAADAIRLLRHAPEKLCVVRVQDGPWRLLVEQEGGRWSADFGVVHHLHIESSLAWQRRVTEAAITGDLGRDEAQACTRWAVVSGTARGARELLASLGGAYLHLLAQDEKPPGLTVCEERELDADPLVLGASNGVICLERGDLLPSDAARAKFVTRSVPDPFNSAAHHRYADELIAHLPDDDRTYLEHALGYALRGNPARRIYVLAGELNGGKSTLLAAIRGALGDVKENGYAMRLDAEALMPNKWGGGPQAHHAGLVGLTQARLAVTEEPKGTRRFNVQLLNDISGGGFQSFRDVGERMGAARQVKATLLMAMNPGQESTIDTSHNALADRVRLLRYPKLPAVDTGAVDPNRTQNVAADGEARQAVLAMLVRWAKATPDRPLEPQSVLDYTQERRLESIGAVGQWLLDRLEVTGNRSDSVNLDALWKVIVTECGGADENGDVDSVSRRAMPALARELVSGLPRAVYTRSGREWRGVRIARLQVWAMGECGICRNQRLVRQADGKGPTCEDCQPRAPHEPPPPGPGAIQGDGNEPAPVKAGPLYAELDALSEALDAEHRKLVPIIREGWRRIPELPNEETAEAMHRWAREDHAGWLAALSEVDGGATAAYERVLLIENELLVIANLATASPDAILSAQHIEAFGGAHTLVRLLVGHDLPVRGQDVPPSYWRPILQELRAKADAAISEATEKARPQLMEWLQWRLVPSMPLQPEGGTA